MKRGECSLGFAHSLADAATAPLIVDAVVLVDRRLVGHGLRKGNVNRLAVAGPEVEFTRNLYRAALGEFGTAGLQGQVLLTRFGIFY